MRQILVTIVMASFFFVSPAAAPATTLGTAFTYQGRLLDSGSAATGEYDLMFTLCDAESAGHDLGVVTLPEVDVNDGYFTVSLDFGSAVFDGTALWLEIAVREGDLSDPDPYTPLSPRQPLTPAPYSISVRTPLELQVTSNLATVKGTNIGSGPGVSGVASSSTGRGVYGEATASSGINYGGSFRTYSADGVGVHGAATAASGTNWGVYGVSMSTSGTGVYGYADNSSGANYGVYGKTDSASGYGGYFEGRGYFSENVGIGVLPDSKLRLDISDSLRIQGLNYSTYPTSGEGLELAYNPASDTAVIQAVDRDAGGVSGKLYLGDGNVGIGTSSPARKLHVRYVMRLEPRASVPSSPSEGDIYMSSTDHKLKVYDGTAWQTCNTSGLALPIAYAVINSDGSVASGSSNVSCTWNVANSYYQITITGESYAWNSYVTVVTPITNVACMAATDSVANKLLVRIRNNAGGSVQLPFQFVTFKP